MTLAAARTRSEATPSRAATPKPAPVVHRISSDSRRYGLSGRVVQPALRSSAAHDPAERKAEKVAALVAPALSKPAGTSRVAQYLTARGGPVLLRGAARLQKLKQNEQTHDTAGAKLNQAVKAVVEPPGEGQSRSNATQVTVVSEQPVPVPDEKRGKQRLRESLQANVPRTIEDVDNFKRNRSAGSIGADVMTVVQGDKNAVVSSFEAMGSTPAAAPPEQTPEALPPAEAAPATAALNLGEGAIAPLQQEHTDLSNYSKEVDSKLKEEGITQEQLDMVDSGDLAAANQEKKGMEKTAKAEPLAVQKFAQQEAQRVDQELRQSEKQEREALNARRKTSLTATTQKQKGTKSALEKKREEVATKINGIYQAAQSKVKKKLADLETQSLKRFDEGNRKATQAFEDQVKAEIEAFKQKRYSGLLGGAKMAYDWLTGIDDMPEVKAIFERNRDAFVATVNQLVEAITADNKRVIQECKEELNAARTAIRNYVEKLSPELKDVGRKASEEMNTKLNEMDAFVGQKEKELQQKLAEKQAASIKAIDDKIEKMKEAMSGALSMLGKFLLAAAKKFFTWALQKFGYSLSDIEGIINKGAAVLKAIFTQPIQFVKNLINAAITGFKNFGKNFLQHLKNALFEWLTGSLQGLVLPKTWDFKGIISVALQMIGISYANIRRHMVAVMSEKVVANLEKTFTLVKTLITEGPIAAWEQLKKMAGEMRDAFIDAVKDFIKMKIIEQAIQWVVSLFIPGAGIVKAIIAIYDTIVFFIQKAKQIAQMVGNFLSAIGAIASGAVGAAANALESGLARGLSLVISFLAALLRLSGITNKIRDAIGKVRGKVDAVLLKVAKWLAEKAKKLLSSFVQAGVPQDPNERLRLGLAAAETAVNALAGDVVQARVMLPVLGLVKTRYAFVTLTATERDGDWWVQGTINPGGGKKTRKRSSPQGQAVATAIIGQNIGNAVLPAEYRRINYEIMAGSGSMPDIQRSGRGYSAPELSCDSPGIIRMGRGLRRADYALIALYEAEIAKITADTGNAMRGNPASLISGLRQRVMQEGGASFANGIRAQMRAIVAFLKGPQRLTFTGVEVPYSARHTIDYTLVEMRGRRSINVAVEVKNWSGGDDLDVLAPRLSNHLQSYIDGLRTGTVVYDELRIQWVGWDVLPRAARRRYMGIITRAQTRAAAAGITFVF